MTEISQKLKEDIFELWFSVTFNNFWSRSSPDYDLVPIGELEVEIDPENAKNINEVESFTIDQDVMGSIKTVYTRKS